MKTFIKIVYVFFCYCLFPLGFLAGLISLGLERGYIKAIFLLSDLFNKEK